jgi:hypothetical protein
MVAAADPAALLDSVAGQQATERRLRPRPRWRITPTANGWLRIKLRGSDAMLPRFACCEEKACRLLSVMAAGAAL